MNIKANETVNFANNGSIKMNWLSEINKTLNSRLTEKTISAKEDSIAPKLLKSILGSFSCFL